MKNNLYIICAFLIVSILLNGCSNSSRNSDYSESYLVEAEENIAFQGEMADFEKISYFEHFKLRYFLELWYEQSIIDETSKSERQLFYNSENEPKNASQDFYNIFLTKSTDLYLLEYLLESIRYRGTGIEYDMVQLITSFVQSIPYEIAAPQKYPYETLYLNKGDCSDKSVLLCKLLNLEGYDACLFTFENAEHMAVGLKTNSQEDSYYGGYCYIESTSISQIGKIPNELVGGIKIEEDPEVIIPDNNGDRVYEEYGELKLFYQKIIDKFGDNYLESSIAEKILLEEMYDYRLKLDSLEIENEMYIAVIDSFDIAIDDLGCNGTVSESVYDECVELVNARNEYIDLYDEFVSILNLVNEEYNFKVDSYNALNNKDKALSLLYQ